MFSHVSCLQAKETSFPNKLFRNLDLEYLVLMQIYRDKIRADVEGKPFVVPPPSEISKKSPSPSASRKNSLSTSRQNEDWGDWGDKPSSQRSMRVENSCSPP